MNRRPDLPLKQYPRFETERLVVREMRDEDAEALFSVYSDQEWLRLWGFPVHRSVEDTRKTIGMTRQAYLDGLQMRWAICLRGDEQPIGSAGYYRFVPPHFRAEITYEQAKSASGKGYMTEALHAIILYGFEHLELHTIEAGIDPEHPNSIRVAKRLGFRQEGLLKENYYFQGKFYDTVLFSCMKEDLVDRPAPSVRKPG